MINTFNFSKSKYCGLWQCPKIAWLRKYKPEEMVLDSKVQERMDIGNDVGDLAMGLFGDYVEVTAYDGDKIDLERMIEATRIELSKQTPIICEASFSFNGLYCAVDILRQENGGWAIYEVKSSTHDDKAVYGADIAYQKYVLEHCGIKVTGTYLVVLNKEYIFDGQLDLQGLFKISDASEMVRSEEPYVEPNIALAMQYLSCDTEPPLDLAECCKEPYTCAFWAYCTRHIPNPSVFNLYRMPFKKELEFYRQGIVSYQDLQCELNALNKKQRRQVEYGVAEKGDYIEKENVRAFLGTLSYPLYFLDFETLMPTVPRYIGTKPFAQVPFQYSLHYIEREGGELKHKEFLAEPGTDPRRPIAERLCEDIPKDVCVTAYFKTFECSRIKELAETFPDLAEHLMNIHDHIVDLLTPFQSGWYYNRAMGGSFSIKSVLPALYPNDPALDYHNLEEIHHGGEAMAAFPAMEHMDAEQREKTRRNLLKYCELDTFAMVKVFEKLREAVE